MYRQSRLGNSSLDEIKQSCEQKLPVIENLSRDLFQSIYSLDIQHNEQSELSPLVRRFNHHILNEVMKSAEYPAMKSICEGRYSRFKKLRAELSRIQEDRFIYYQSEAEGLLLLQLNECFSEQFVTYITTDGEDTMPLDEFIRSADSGTIYYIGGIVAYHI